MSGEALALKEAGYRVSAQITDAEAEMAANDVTEAYVRPIFDFDRPSNDITEAIRHLTYILLLQRHAVATRSGGKTKLTPSMSENAGPTQQDFEKADRLLRVIQKEHDAVQGEPSKIVDDICGIYYRNVYMAL